MRYEGGALENAGLSDSIYPWYSMPRQYLPSSRRDGSITMAFIRTGATISEPIVDQSKSRRAAKRRRNLVAKNNKNKGGVHRAKKDYRRKEKYPVDFVV